MPAQPLTHHDILALVEPFSRRGRHLDLGASNRLERRLLFKPIEHPAEDGGLPALRETLQLECFGPKQFGLSRVLKLPCGLEAHLEAAGEDPGALLAGIETVAPQRQITSAAGYLIAQSHRLEQSDGKVTELLLTHGFAKLDGLTFKLRATTVRGYPADLELHNEGDLIPLPEDLLAVLGWNWTRLAADGDHWNSKLRIRGGEPKRSRIAEIKLEEAARYLAATLAEPPSRYHERRVAARWGVVFRRAIPILSGIALMFGAVAASRLDLPEHSPIRMLIFNSPTLLIAIAFCMQEMPRLEIPPLPRRLRAPAWRRPQPTATELQPA